MVAAPDLVPLVDTSSVPGHAPPAEGRGRRGSRDQRDIPLVPRDCEDGGRPTTYGDAGAGHAPDTDGSADGPVAYRGARSDVSMSF